MRMTLRLILTVAAACPFASASAARADDAPLPPPAKPAASKDGAAVPEAPKPAPAKPDGEPAAKPPEKADSAPEKPEAKPDARPGATPGETTSATDRSAFREAVEGLFGAPVHGSFTTRYRVRRTNGETDQDLYSYLDMRVGDESKDRWSGALFMRAAADLDQAHTDRHGGYVFDSLADTSGSRVTAELYDAYATLRPEGGKVRQARFGRQYVYAGETFHFDGASATTRPLHDATKLEITGYGGIPVHFDESSSGGDWLAGLKLAAEPWKGGRAHVEWTHVQDRLSILGTERNDLASLSLWQSVSKPVTLFGQCTWLEGPRDATLRATWTDPDRDLLVQAGAYRLFDEKQEFATEFDPYFRTILDLERYDQGVLRVSKGFGESFDVEVGASARDVTREEREGPYNRDTRRVHVTPTWSGFPWERSALSLTGESVSGDGERVKTWGFDLTHRFDGGTRVSVGSDYSLYAFGPLGPTLSGAGERTHVRTVYARARFQVSDTVSADVQYSWEKDDVETFHLLSLGVTVRF
ncbi:MAG: hypothetical protein HMLKMBBP_00414 [Planctomycetes bacterium]|nr:hypothetical protein [Planctomycetota bacterium]